MLTDNIQPLSEQICAVFVEFLEHFSAADYPGASHRFHALITLVKAQESEIEALKRERDALAIAFKEAINAHRNRDIAHA
jgi:hypothetical protein